MTFFENTQKLLTRSFSSMLINERPSTEKVQGYIASIRLSSRGTNYRETCLFFYYDAILDKITYHVTYQGNSGYKEFTLFVRDVLDRVKGGGCVTIGVPDVGLNSRIKDIAKHCNVNLMPYSGTNPEILKLVYSVGTYLDVSGKTTPEEFDMLVETVNKILKQKNVKYKGLNKNLVKVQTLVKRMYSTLSRKKTILVPANTWEEKLLSLKQGGYDNLDNRTPLVQKITTPNT